MMRDRRKTEAPPEARERQSKKFIIQTLYLDYKELLGTINSIKEKSRNTQAKMKKDRKTRACKCRESQRLQEIK